MVTVTDGENEFEVVNFGFPQDGEWFLNSDGATERWHGPPRAFGRSILRPISGPAARPERRKDAKARCEAGQMEECGHLRPAFRRGYQRGYQQAQREAKTLGSKP